MDWKSLTIPACLPITTDYFPDKRSLQNDYLVSDYNLLPDDVNADFAQNRAIYKKPLTTMEVFKELVSQRLAQVYYFRLFYISLICHFNWYYYLLIRILKYNYLIYNLSRNNEVNLSIFENDYVPAFCYFFMMSSDERTKSYDWW